MNKVLLVGRLTNDVKVYSTASGVNYARATLAVNRRNTGNNEITDFIPLVAWRWNADFLGKYGTKGSLLSIEGSFTTSQYQKNGETIRNYEVTVDSVSLLEPRSLREKRNENTSNNWAPQDNYNNQYKNNSYQNNKFNSDQSSKLEENKFVENSKSDDQNQTQTFSFDLEDDLV